MLATQELSRMRRAAAVLPLADALETRMPALVGYASDTDLQKCRQDGVPLEPDIMAFTEIISAVRDGAVLAMTYESTNAMEKEFKIALAERDSAHFDPPPGADTLSRIRMLNEISSFWLQTRMVQNRKTFDDAKETTARVAQMRGIGGKAIKEAEKSGWSIMEQMLQDNVTVAVIRTTAKILRPEEIVDLQELAMIGRKTIARYGKLNRILDGTKSPKKRMACLKERFAIACPEAIAAIREQSGIKALKRELPAAMPEDESVAPSPEKQTRRSESEDAKILKRDYPGLSRKIMAPTGAELELKELKRSVSQLKREGMPYEAIQGFMREGITTKEGIRSAYESRGRKVKDAEAPAEYRRKKPKWQAAQNGAPEQNGTQKAPKDVRNMDELISSIQLSEEARRHIRDAGMNPADVLFSVFKGFDIMKNGAVGGGHYRGVIIRKNIRKCMKRRYAERPDEAPSDDDILDFLKSVDLIVESGSSASTRTKDEAMSLNTSPGHPVGADIMRAVTAAQIGHMKGKKN